MKRILVTLSLALVMMGCEAREPAQQEASPPVASTQALEPSAHTPKTADPGLREELLEKARKRKGGKEPTQLDLFNELMRKGAEKAGAIPDYGKPRIVPKGAKPEIVIKGDKITYNGKQLVLGASLREWERILGKPNRRDEDKPPALLVWDNLGFHVMADTKNKVDQIKIYINKRPIDPYKGLVTHNPDGTPITPDVDYAPKQAFSGYLELDGFGIDAKTEFWELLSTANPERRLTCGTRDCTHPSGSLGGNSGVLYLTTNRNDEHGTIYEFSIGR